MPRITVNTSKNIGWALGGLASSRAVGLHRWGRLAVQPHTLFTMGRSLAFALALAAATASNAGGGRGRGVGAARPRPVRAPDGSAMSIRRKAVWGVS